MSRLYEYLAMIGWAWCALVAIVLTVLFWKHSRRESRGFEVPTASSQSCKVVASERHEE